MSPEAYLLADQHGGLWKENDQYPLSQWQHDVANDDTRLGYWDWLLQRLEIASDIPSDSQVAKQFEVPNDE